MDAFLFKAGKHFIMCATALSPVKIRLAGYSLHLTLFVLGFALLFLALLVYAWTCDSISKYTRKE